MFLALSSLMLSSPWEMRIMHFWCLKSTGQPGTLSLRKPAMNLALWQGLSVARNPQNSPGKLFVAVLFRFNKYLSISSASPRASIVNSCCHESHILHP